MGKYTFAADDIASSRDGDETLNRFLYTAM
jgi:hypothetical protein